MEPTGKFWLVWCEPKAGELRPRGSAPTFKHETEEGARAEAERLARERRGSRFHVLEVVASVKHNDMEWTEQPRDGVTLNLGLCEMSISGFSGSR